MKSRGRKPSVSAGLRKEWLSRFEGGESVPRIADSDDWDVRTVRKQLELAKQEREVSEARHMVLRQALQDHYADLCSIAEKLDSKLTKDFEHILLLDDRDIRIYQALRQHLPKSPLWRQLEEWDRLVDQLEARVSQLRKALIKRAEERLPIKLTGPKGEFDMLMGFTDSLLFHLQSLAREWKGFKDMTYISSQLEDHQTSMRHGAFFWTVPDNLANDIQKQHSDLKTEGTGWEEYEQMRICLKGLIELRESLRDELAIVILKRVVPGRCIYCPL